jgi:hypothetical protein
MENGKWKMENGKWKMEAVRECDEGAPLAKVELMRVEKLKVYCGDTFVIRSGAAQDLRKGEDDVL